MRVGLCSALFFLSCSVFAACKPPERFTALEQPISAEVLPFSPQDQRQFPVQMVNFWALWCAPCRAELPFLKKLSEAGIPVVLVNLGDDPTAAQAFLEQIEVADLPQIHLEGELPAELGITGFPATFLFQNGALRYRTQGALKAADEKALLSYAACFSPS